jgi:hypothetical protein
MRKLIVLTLGFVLLALVSFSAWETKPPKPPVEKHQEFAIGHWVKYQIKRYAKDDTSTDKESTEITALSESDMKISVVKKEILRYISPDEFIWLEFLINEGKEQERIIQFMINPKGVPQPERLILKYGRMPAVDMNLRMWEVKTRITRSTLFEEMTERLNIIPFTRLAQPDETTQKEKITLNLNGQETTLDCFKILFDIPDANTTGYVWYSDQIPLAGLVKFFLVEDKYKTIILLSEYSDSGGRSKITETPQKLDFRGK